MSEHQKTCKHVIQFQLSDSLGFLVPGTQFDVTIVILKNGDKVTIQFPVINFQTGPLSPDDIVPPLVLGGYLYSVNGFLPKDVHPDDIVFGSFLAPSNNGMSLPFSFSQDPSTLPSPPVAYILQITNFGQVIVQAAGTFGNIIPPGPQIILPTDITYIINKKQKLKDNLVFDKSLTNVLHFTNPSAINDGVRDSHVNDAFDNLLVWNWTSNSEQADKTNNTMDTFVAIGKVSKRGNLKIRSITNLTKFTSPNLQSWDTAAAINRTNKNNIVISYGVIDRTVSPSLSRPFRVVSFDGGKTWPVFGSSLNGLLNVQPTGTPPTFGDNRGVASDKYGNIWYSSTNRFDSAGNFINQPFFAVSIDGGISFNNIFTFPLPDDGNFYDFPQYCFGGDGQGGYALQFASSLGLANGDFPFVTGFIPITDLGQFGTPQFAILNSLNNVNYNPIPAASSDGRVWYPGVPDSFGAYSFIQPEGVVFKSPGPVDQNYAGPWHTVIHNLRGLTHGEESGQLSQPFLGYFTTAQDALYDDNRQALYIVYSVQHPLASAVEVSQNSQNMSIYFIISRNNGQTWSHPINISTSDEGNRGFPSMALDSVTGNLIFGWYDGRNDPTYQSVQYFATFIPAKTLDKLVDKIPLSNPLYSIPSATATLHESKVKSSQSRKMALHKRIEKKFGITLPIKPS